MIPKLLHQTYKTADIPGKWRKYQRKLRELHPDWSYQLWTDQDNKQFVRSEFPDFYEIFMKLPRNIMRADVIRYLLLYRLGGLYLDLDYEMLKPFDLLHHETVLPLEQDQPEPDGRYRVANALIAAAPGSAFFKLAIDQLKANPPLAADSDVEATTGPGFLSRVYRQAQAEKIEVFLPAKALFNPTTPASPRQHRAIVRAGVAYGIHHTHGSWREYSLPRRIRRRVGMIVKWFM